MGYVQSDPYGPMSGSNLVSFEQDLDVSLQPSNWLTDWLIERMIIKFAYM